MYNNEKLEKLSTQELIDIAEYSLVSQIRMIRRIPTLIMRLNTSDIDYKVERDKYAKLIIDLGDNAHSLPSQIKQKNRKGLLFELSSMIDFLSEIQDNKELINELNAYQIINFYNDKGLLNSL